MISRGQDIRLQESREVILGQVEGLVGVMPIAANERIDWVPVGPAQLSERRPRLGRGRSADTGDPTPVGRREAGWWGWLVHEGPDAEAGPRAGEDPGRNSATLRHAGPPFKGLDATATSPRARLGVRKPWRSISQCS